MMDKKVTEWLRQQATLREEIVFYYLTEITRIARLVVGSPPRSAKMVRLISKLKEKIEELDRI